MVDNNADTTEGCSSASVEPIDTTAADSNNQNSENCVGVPREVCDCDDEDTFQLLDTVTTYLQSAVSVDIKRLPGAFFSNYFLLLFL